jgi:hypothetical protein
MQTRVGRKLERRGDGVDRLRAERRHDFDVRAETQAISDGWRPFKPTHEPPEAARRLLGA